MIPWILATICVEAITEIIVDSTIFIRFRNFIAKISAFLGELISCGYCLSVWISMPVAWALPGQVFDHPIADILIKTFVLHRITNIWHEAIKRWLDRHPFVLMINSVQSQSSDIIEDEDDDEEQD